MLISFILLLLLTWMLVEGKDLQDKLNQGQKALEQEREFRGQFTDEQQTLMLTYRDSLPEIDKHRDSVTAHPIYKSLKLHNSFKANRSDKIPHSP